ncbi:hypothetical protein [Nocardioides kribbensis]|uniref:Uncharacterized protein n=1 Tax=Nocardioides kribbensis TaxID=305517 RepID=A0ABV1P2J4_9ACTN
MHVYAGGDDPAAAIIWVTHGVNGVEAVRLASSERDVLDLIVILDAVVAAHPDRSWPPSKVQLAASWVAVTAIPSDRAALYVTAGITLREAAGFEADPDTRPSGAQLALLAGLRAPVDPS